MSNEILPHGYPETMDCLNKPSDWDVPAMIEDVGEYLKQGKEVPPGQVLAMLDWMAFRLKECRAILVCADSELSAMLHGRPEDEEECERIVQTSRTLCRKLKGF